MMQLSCMIADVGEERSGVEEWSGVRVVMWVIPGKRIVPFRTCFYAILRSSRFEKGENSLIIIIVASS
jgi:hypothetical protein